MKSLTTKVVHGDMYNAKAASKIVGVRPCDLKRDFPQYAKRGYPWLISGRELEWLFTVSPEVKKAVLDPEPSKTVVLPGGILQEVSKF